VATYRTRLRFRLLKKLSIKEPEHRFHIAGHEVVLSATVPELAIEESKWLIMNARDFATQSDATDFGHRLRTALELSSVATRLGVDAGCDLPTSSIAESLKNEISKKTGALVRDNVHGVDVFQDNPNVSIFGISAKCNWNGAQEPGSVPALLDELVKAPATCSVEAKDVILLLNYALMRPEPVAQILFAVSAVEMLGRTRRGQPTRRRCLKT